MNNVVFTKFKSTEPLSKRYWLEGDAIHKQAAAQMHTGTAERVTMPFADFAQALSNADSKAAFGYGTHALNYPDKVKIVVSGKEKPGQNSIARTKAFYSYSCQSGVLMLDHDPSQYGKPLTHADLMRALATIHPETSSAARVVRGSVSAGVHKADEQPSESKGFHIYIPVSNAADIPRYGSVLFKRLWLTGHGYIALASNGSMLIRTCIDGAVFSPERLDFVGKPIIAGSGLAYTAPEASYTEGGLLDTESLQDLTTSEQSDYEQLIADAKAAMASQSQALRGAWANDKVQAMQDKGVPLEKAQTVVNQILSGDCKDLYDDFILEFSTGNLTVKEMLDDGKAHDKRALADPIEGSAKGFTKAMFYWNYGNKPFIHSFAHGDTKYFLHASIERSEPDDWQAKLSAHVEEFNNIYASVHVGGKHRIMRFVPNDPAKEKRASYDFFSRNDLSLLHDNEIIQTGFDWRGNPRYTNKLLAWAKHRNARTYRGGVVFLPGKDVPKGYFNTWQGFAVESMQNDALLERIYYHMREIVCGGNAELYEYLKKWIAYTFQNPDKPAGSALVLRGEKGSGKGTLGHFFRSIWGNHGLHISNAKHLVGNFNGHLADTCFLFADEAFYSGDKQHEGVLKALVTEPVITSERKGIDAVTQPNYLKVFMATNSDFAVPASRDERRYCVFDVLSTHKGDRDYFNDLHADCASKAVQAAFLYSMLDVDLTGWHSGDIPETAGLRAQRYHSMDSVQKWLIDCLIRGNFVQDEGIGSFQSTMLSSKLYEYYLAWCDDVKAGEYRRATQTAFGRYLGLLFSRKRGSDGRFVYFFGHLPDAIRTVEQYEKLSIAELAAVQVEN